MPQSKEMEQEASLFAMLLLMPTKFIEQDLNKGFDMGSDEDMKALAKKYGVSLTALVVRILSVGDDFAIIASTEFD